MWVPSSTKRCCRNCHFFAKRIVVLHRLNERIFLTLRPQERTNLKVDEMEWLACAQEVWGADREVNGEEVREIVDKPRRDQCFFWVVQEGMSFEAAKVLQERAAEHRELKKSHWHTQIGLWIAAAGLLLSALYGLLRLWIE